MSSGQFLAATNPLPGLVVRDGALTSSFRASGGGATANFQKMIYLKFARLSGKPSVGLIPLTNMPKTPPPGHPEQVMRGWTEFTRSGGSWITPLMSLPTKPQVVPEATLAAGAMVTTITATTSLTTCRHCSHKRSRLGAYGARLLPVNKVRCRHCFYKRRGCPRWPMVTSRYARVAWRLRDTSCLLLVDMVLCRHCSHKRRGCLRLGVACGHASPAYIVMCRHCSHKRRGVHDDAA